MSPAHRIAAEFSRRVREDIAGLLTEPSYLQRHHLDFKDGGETIDDVMKEIVRRNTTPDYAEHSCATHDFCDANMPMFEAFEKVVGRELNLEDDAEMKLINKAWTIARKAEFRWAR